MFVLRIISEERADENSAFEQTIKNIELGCWYTKFERNGYPKLDNIIKKELPECNPEDVKMLIISEAHRIHYILKSTETLNYSYYIMNENGSTFERL